jgi:L-asparaginase
MKTFLSPDSLKSQQSNERLPLTILTTGGTIEKRYDEDNGLLTNRESIIEERLNQKLRLPYLDIQIVHLLAKDSLLMDDQDRAVLWSGIEERLALKRPLIILHGTDTVHKSLAFCEEQVKKKSLSIQVAIVFTGAMVPLEMENTDGWQNLTEALLAAQYLTPGLYFSFHSRIYKSPHLIKDRQKKTFAYPPH